MQSTVGKRYDCCCATSIAGAIALSNILVCLTITVCASSCRKMGACICRGWASLRMGLSSTWALG